MEEQQVLLDTFVAKMKQSAALCRGDRIQVENYAVTLYRFTAGEYGHFTAAAAGESLAIKVLTQVVDYCTSEFVVNGLLGDALVPGYADKRLRAFLSEVLDRELPLTLGDIPDATKQMICDEIWVIALDVCRGKNSKAVMLWESAARESRSSRIQQVLDTHAPWVGKLLTELVKSVNR